MNKQINQDARLLHAKFQADFWRCYVNMLMLGDGRRRGQMMMDTLLAVDPEMYQLVNESGFDPYYNDKHIPEFRKELGL